MGTGELARAPLISCFSVVQVVFHYKGGARNAPLAPVNGIWYHFPVCERNDSNV